MSRRKTKEMRDSGMRRKDCVALGIFRVRKRADSRQTVPGGRISRIRERVKPPKVAASQPPTPR